MSYKYMYLYECLYCTSESPLRGLAGLCPPEGLSRPGAGPGRAALGVPAATNWQLRRCYSAQTLLLGPAWRSMLIVRHSSAWPR